MSVQDEKRWIPGCWRGASEAHIRSDLQRASNEARSPEDKRIRLILNAHWNYSWPLFKGSSMNRSSLRDSSKATGVAAHFWA